MCVCVCVCVQHTHMAMYKGKCCGVVVCKLEQHRDYFRGDLHCPFLARV